MLFLDNTQRLMTDQQTTLILEDFEEKIEFDPECNKTQ
jgi:hypothetical protein